MKKCQARVEYLAIRDEVDDLLSKGYSVVSIYSYLKEEKKISMSYRSLLYYIKGRASKAKLKNNKSTLVNHVEINSSQRPDHQSSAVVNKDRRFVMPKE